MYPSMVSAAYIRNHCLTAAIPNGKTPFEMFYGKIPDVSHMRIFGSKVYVYNNDPKLRKFDDRALEGIFMGYGEQTKGYIVYVPKLGKLITNRNVQFFEIKPIENNNLKIIPNISNDYVTLPT